jgi:hypothetical protein
MDETGSSALRSALAEETRDVVVPDGLLEQAVRRGRGRLRRRRSLGAGAAVVALAAGGVVAVQVDPLTGSDAASGSASESAAGAAGAASEAASGAEASPSSAGAQLADSEGTPAAAGAAPCPPGGWTASMPSDFEGEPDPPAALRAWLDGDPSMPAPHAEPPRDGWVEDPSSRVDVVTMTNGDWEVTITRSTRGEWLVTASGCW